MMDEAMPISWRRLSIISAVFSALFVCLYMQTNFFKRVSSYVVYPVLLLQHALIDPIKQQQKSLYTIEELQEQLSQVRKEYEGLLADTIQLRAQQAYLDRTHDLREFKKRYAEDASIIAHVLVRNFSEQDHYFLIDAGSSSGIEKDMVVTFKNNLVGKISEVYPWYSKVCLITNRLCKVAAYCSQTKAQGIHEGSNNEEETMLAYVSHLAPIKENDLIISSGEGLVFPEGFALGRIHSSRQDGLYKKIQVKPLCDMRRLDYCLVLKKQ